VRYIYGITFMPFEFKMAVLEAAEGKVRPTVSRVLLYCFSYDPAGRRYVFDILKVSGTVILFVAAVFIAYLTLGGRKKEGAA
jgi:protein SCO1/2